MDAWGKGLPLLMISLTLAGCTTNKAYFHRYQIKQTSDNPALSMPPGLELKQSQTYRLPSAQPQTVATTANTTRTDTAETLTSAERAVDYHYPMERSLDSVWQAFPQAVAANHYRLLQTSQALHTFYIAKPKRSDGTPGSLYQVQQEATPQGVTILVLNNQNQPVPISQIQDIIDYLERHTS